MWTGKTIVIGVTGGIAAYKAAELVSTLRKLGAAVEVVMTAAAKEFVAPLTFRELSGNAVAQDLFAPPARFEVQHVALAERADVVAVVPATANTLAKIAAGMADDLLTSIILATRKPVLLAPAMNTGMFENPATQQNLALLRRRGFAVVGPASGRLLCGASGIGRLAPLKEIVFALERLLTPADFAGRRVLVTAGGTREALDPVRFLGNRSSGRMGLALARSFARRGAEVSLVAGQLAEEIPFFADTTTVETTAEMRQAVLAKSSDMDVVVMAGAPADFRPAAFSTAKIKRSRCFQLELVPTEDIAAEIGRNKKKGQILVIFAAETGDPLHEARAKLAKKGADLVVANDVSALGSGFEVETNQVHILSAADTLSLPLLSKTEAAERIVDAVADLAAGRGLNG